MVCIYGTVGFIVQTMLMDMEFKKLRDKLPNVILNTTAAQEHVGEIERKIQVVKERARLHDKHPALQSTNKAHDNRVNALLRYVDDLLFSKIGHL